MIASSVGGGRRRTWCAVVLGAALTACSGLNSGGITSSTTCREYLGFDSEQRSAAVRTLGVDAGWSDAGNPMAVLSFDAHCGQRPNQTMETAIELFAN